MPDSVLSVFRAADRFVLSTHTRPDGDAIGSELALARFLRAQGKQVTILNQDPAPYNLDWMIEEGEIEVYEGSVAQLEALDQADVVVVLDTNAEHRLGAIGSFIRRSGGEKVIIDHHTDPEGWFNAELVRDTASSTGELVYELLRDWDAEGIDRSIAVPLYAAIMTDTGSFRFSNVTPRLHEIIADLMARGDLDASRIYAEIHDRKSIEALHLLGQVLNSIELAYDGAIATAVVSKRAMRDTGGASEETDGFVNHLLSIDGVRVAALLTETESGTKISFRSRADDHVHKWAQSLGGGGHRNASGAFIQEGLEETRATVVKTAPNYIDLETSDEDGLDPEDAEYLSSLTNMQTRNSPS